jgi:hypothetical protein
MTALRAASGVMPVLFLVLAGCGGGDAIGDADRKPTQTVTGTVKFAGSAVADAAVTFSPVGKTPVAMGRTDAAGKYSLTTYQTGDGAVAGEYVVLVTKSSAPAASSGGALSHDSLLASGAPTHGGGRAAPKLETLLPEKYASVESSDLKKTVEEGKENVIDLELTP